MLLLLLGCPAPQSHTPKNPSIHYVETDTSPTDSSVLESQTDSSSDSPDSPSDSVVDTGPFDVDQDGFLSTEQGGEDCDDHRADINPDAEEWCDDIDWNCDGEAYEEGVCAKPQRLDIIADGIWVGQGVLGASLYRFAPLLDLNGDEKQEISLIGGGMSYDGSCDCGAAYVLTTPAPLSQAMNRDDTVVASWVGYPNAMAGFMYDAGDFNGDGFRDVWVQGSDWTTPNLYLGPSTDWGVGGTVDWGDAYFIVEDAYDALANEPPASNQDFNQDGLADTIFTDHSDGDIFLIPGQTNPIQSNHIEDQIRLYGGQYGVQAGDLTGDGLADLLVNQYNQQLSLVDGTDLFSLDGSNIEDIRYAYITYSGGIANAPAIIGDWTGDGMGDWVVGSPNATSSNDHEGEIFLVAGYLPSGVTPDQDLSSAAIASQIGGAEDAMLGQNGVKPLCDLDGDNRPEFSAMLVEDGFLTQSIFLSSEGFSTLNAPLPVRRLRLASPEDAFSHPAAGGEFTGDSRCDLLIDSPYWNDGQTRGFLLAGDSIPWNDSTVWDLP